MYVISNFMQHSIKKIQIGRYDIYAWKFCTNSSLGFLVSILTLYVFFTLIENQYSLYYGRHFDLYSKMCDDFLYSTKTNLSGKNMGVSQ